MCGGGSRLGAKQCSHAEAQQMANWNIFCAFKYANILFADDDDDDIDLAWRRGRSLVEGFFQFELRDVIWSSKSLQGWWWCGCWSGWWLRLCWCWCWGWRLCRWSCWDRFHHLGRISLFRLIFSTANLNKYLKNALRCWGTVEILRCWWKLFI